MEVTPQLLNDVEFREARKGYDTRDVDDFLERLGVAVGALQERLQAAEARVADAETHAQAAEARAAAAETRVADAEARLRDASESEETLRRTLVLAQRTADAAIQEAEETAARTVATAQEEADRLVTDARDEVARLKAEGEGEVRRAVEGTRQRLDDEIRALEATRDELRQDAEVLERHVGDQRERVRQAVAELQRVLDDPEALRVAPAPDTGGADRSETEPTPEATPEATPEIEMEPEPEPEPVVVVAGEPEPVSAEPEASVIDIDTSITEEGGPPTEPVEMLDLVDDDAYLAELRKAMTDDTPLGPRDEEAPAFTPQDVASFFEPADDAPRARPRFGRRR